MDGLYIHSDACALVETGCEVMIIGRTHGSANAKAVLSFEALEPDCLVEIRSGGSADTDSFTATTQVTLNYRGYRDSVELPVGGAALNQITAMRVLRGRVSAAVVAPHQVQMCFRTRKHP